MKNNELLKLCDEVIHSYADYLPHAEHHPWEMTLYKVATFARSLLLQPQAVPDVQKLLDAALEVTAWDWSDNDADCVADMDRLRKIAESMYLSAAPQAVPDGYRLVPEFATPKMMEAGVIGWCEKNHGSLNARAHGCYLAMLSAAPQPAPDGGTNYKWAISQLRRMLDESRKPPRTGDIVQIRSDLFELIAETILSTPPASVSEDKP